MKTDFKKTKAEKSSENWAFIKYELKEKKDKVLSIRLSEKLLDKIKSESKKSGLGVQKYLRILIESSIRKRQVDQ